MRFRLVCKILTSVEEMSKQLGEIKQLLLVMARGDIQKELETIIHLYESLED